MKKSFKQIYCSANGLMVILLISIDLVVLVWPQTFGGNTTVLLKQLKRKKHPSALLEFGKAKLSI